MGARAFVWAGHNSASGAVSIAAWCLGVGGHNGNSNDGDDGDGNSGGDVMRWWSVIAMKQGQ